MGLFTKKPYKLNSLNSVEKAACTAAMEVALALDRQGKVSKELSTALKHFNKGALSKQDMAVVIACLVGSLKAVNDGGDPERSSQLKKKAVVQVSMALALDKLQKLL